MSINPTPQETWRPLSFYELKDRDSHPNVPTKNATRIQHMYIKGAQRAHPRSTPTWKAAYTDVLVCPGGYSSSASANAVRLEGDQFTGFLPRNMCPSVNILPNTCSGRRVQQAVGGRQATDPANSDVAEVFRCLPSSKNTTGRPASTKKTSACDP